MKLNKGERMSTRTVVDTGFIAESLAENLAKKIIENTSITTEFSNGKLNAKISINQDYLRGIEDAVNALADLEVDIYE